MLNPNIELSHALDAQVTDNTCVSVSNIGDGDKARSQSKDNWQAETCTCTYVFKLFIKYI